MDLKLKILFGTNAGQEVTITGQTFLIGRAEDCHLRPGSDMISRHHCAIVVDQSYAAIRDFGSKNGTYLNNERVLGESELKSGDQLRVGPLWFEILLLQGELGGKKKPPVSNAKEAAERTAASQPDETDVAQWLDDPATEPQGTVDSQCAAALETQSIRLTETEQIALTRPRASAAPQSQHPAAQSSAAPSPVPQPAAARPIAVPQPIPAATASATAPVAPAAVSPANVPKRALPSTFQMPEPEAPAPVAADKTGRLDKKKVFGKLPTQEIRPENTRSAAAELLDKMRKRR